MTTGTLINTGATIVVALIALWSARSTQRNAAAANRQVAEDTSRAQAETDAYTRARALDTETIARLERREAELEGDLAELEREAAGLRTENGMLRRLLATHVHDETDGETSGSE